MKTVYNVTKGRQSAILGKVSRLSNEAAEAVVKAGTAKYCPKSVYKTLMKKKETKK